ncbi:MULTISPECIES: cobalt-precorrin 5A hydrolase [unclassified Granulicatella]|uniref:cobalt-precorrin 5A hydrolase n=1 Tax=unclassified Granulicatella TaxID=2630493 RepID=UPI001D164229|nr:MULTISPECIES: cobalt-precorrin 5A hydrolase [unclassified Granulicatella]
MTNSPNIAIVALTEYGKQTALTLKSRLNEARCTVYTTAKIADNQVTALQGKTIEAIRELFQSVDVLICIMATGIVIRSIAPAVHDKLADPAVIVMDERAKNVISLLSGHMGGANQITQNIATLMDANPVITTATDVHDVQALDMIAKSVNGWRDELRPLLLAFNGYLAGKQTVYFYQEKPWVNDFRGLSIIQEEDIPNIIQSRAPFIMLTTQSEHAHRENMVVIYPRPYVLGVGARKQVDSQVFKANFELFCEQQKISPREIGLIASIDVKKEEQAILDLAKELDCDFVTFTKDELATVDGKYPQSEFVKKTVGVGSVALASADYASNAQVISERFAKDGCTYALAKYTNKR